MMVRHVHCFVQLYAMSTKTYEQPIHDTIKKLARETCSSRFAQETRTSYMLCCVSFFL